MSNASDDLVGRAGSPYTIRVTADDIGRFAVATMSADPAYSAQDPPMPLTFLSTAPRWQKPENSPYGDQPRDLSRTLHGEQEYIFYPPMVRAGAQLSGHTRIARRYMKEGERSGQMWFTEQISEYRDATGRLVAEARAVHIELGHD